MGVVPVRVQGPRLGRSWPSRGAMSPKKWVPKHVEWHPEHAKRLEEGRARRPDPYSGSAAAEAAVAESMTMAAAIERRMRNRASGSGEPFAPERGVVSGDTELSSAAVMTAQREFHKKVRV